MTTTKQPTTWGITTEKVWWSPPSTSTTAPKVTTKRPTTWGSTTQKVWWSPASTSTTAPKTWWQQPSTWWSPESHTSSKWDVFATKATTTQKPTTPQKPTTARQTWWSRATTAKINSERITASAEQSSCQ